MRGDCTRNGGPAGPHSGEGSGRAAVLQNNTQLWEFLMEGLQRWQESWLCVEDSDGRAIFRGMGVGGGGGDFAVEVEDHVLFFHLRKDGVE